MAEFLWDKQDLSDYSIGEKGFLPEEEPLGRFSESENFEDYDTDTQDYLNRLDDFYDDLPEMLAADSIDDHIRNQAWKLPEAPESLYEELSDRELMALYRKAAFGASGYVHALESAEVDHIPPQISEQLHESTRQLGKDTPILSYDAYSLFNWQKDDPDGEIDIDNLSTLQNFVDMEDEEWFIIVHVEIEDEAAPAIRAIPDVQRAIYEDDEQRMADGLSVMSDTLSQTVETMARMPEENSPDNYWSDFRPYIDEFEDILYMDVDEFEGEQQSFRGETGAQSSIYPALDGVFKIPHEETELTLHLDDMRAYMPEGHRRFIQDVEEFASEHRGITEFIREKDYTELQEPHDDVLWNMNAFRSLHNFYAHRYIDDKTDDPRGTGGTDYRKFLKQLIEETEEQMFRDGPTSPIDYTAEVLGEDRLMRLMEKFAGQ